MVRRGRKGGKKKKNPFDPVLLPMLCNAASEPCATGRKGGKGKKQPPASGGWQPRPRPPPKIQKEEEKGGEEKSGWRPCVFIPSPRQRKGKKGGGREPPPPRTNVSPVRCDHLFDVRGSNPGGRKGKKRKGEHPSLLGQPFEHLHHLHSLEIDADAECLGRKEGGGERRKKEIYNNSSRSALHLFVCIGSQRERSLFFQISFLAFPFWRKLELCPQEKKGALAPYPRVFSPRAKTGREGRKRERDNFISIFLFDGIIAGVEKKRENHASA